MPLYALHPEISVTYGIFHQQKSVPSIIQLQKSVPPILHQQKSVPLPLPSILHLQEIGALYTPPSEITAPYTQPT